MSTATCYQCGRTFPAGRAQTRRLALWRDPGVLDRAHTIDVEVCPGCSTPRARWPDMGVLALAFALASGAALWVLGLGR
jgi:hypothetical protein